MLGLPLDLLVFLGAVAVAFLPLRHARQGRFLYLIGDNFQAACAMGIPVRPLIVASFMAWLSDHVGEADHRAISA